MATWLICKAMAEHGSAHEPFGLNDRRVMMATWVNQTGKPGWMNCSKCGKRVGSWYICKKCSAVACSSCASGRCKQCND